MKKITLTYYIIDTNIKVTFELSEQDYIHFRYARGNITEAEAKTQLGADLNPVAIRRMEKIAKHLS